MRVALALVVLALVPATAGAACRPTLPNGRTPPGERQSAEHHGNGRLWTEFPQDGVFEVPAGPVPAGAIGVQPDGSIREKFAWWGSRRAGRHLRISGKRLDGQAAHLRARIADGQTNAPHFWASSLFFTTPGCWRVTARSGRARLRFVVEVRTYM